MSSPSGDSVRITGGDYEAEVVEVGAGLRSLRRAGLDVVAGYSSSEMCTSGRGQLLVPWPNRIADGRYQFAGKPQQLALSEAAKNNAIHGLTRWVTWSLRQASESSVVGMYRLRPQPGYPFALDLQVSYTLSDDGLRVDVGATNVGDSTAPYGHGAHPFLTVGRKIDGCELLLPASMRCPADERGLPQPAEPVAGTRYDFTRPRLIGATSFDHPFTGLDLVGGRSRTTLRDPDTGREASLWADPSYPWLQVFSGDGLGARAREALAVEPMTCPPNAFNSGVDLVVLAPGESHRGFFGLS